MCANGNDVVLFLGDECTLHAHATSTVYATILPDQLCTMAFERGTPQTIRVGTGTFFISLRQAVRVTFGGHLEGAPESHVAFDLAGPDPEVTLGDCEDAPGRDSTKGEGGADY
jgi:hypothetical protein